MSNRKESIVKSAVKYFERKDFRTAHEYYSRAANIYGYALFAGNVQLCERRLLTNERKTTDISRSLSITADTSSGSLPANKWKGEGEELSTKYDYHPVRYLKDTDGWIGAAIGKPAKTEMEFIQASKIAKGEENYQLENAILHSAKERFPSSALIANALFWSCKRVHDLDSCKALVDDIKRIYGDNPTNKQLTQLSKLKSAIPEDLVSIFQYLGNVDPIEKPISQKLAYVLHNTLPYSSGGYATRAEGLIQGLLKSNIEIDVISRPGYPLDIRSDINETDIPTIEFVSKVEHHRILHPRRRGLPALEYMMQASDALEHKLREIRPSIVMAASNHVTAIPAYIASKRLGLPFVYEVRGFWEITRKSREPDFVNNPAYTTIVKLESSVARRADWVFTLTEPMKEELIRRGVEESKITLLPNSCDTERFEPINRDEKLASRLGIPLGIPVIGYVGTFVVYEGLEDLALACSILKRRGYEFRLMLVGNENTSGNDTGPITKQILNIAKCYEFDNWLIMPGRVPHDHVEHYYSLIDIAPFPRKAWPVCEMVSPMKPLEALAMEKAVVVSNVRALAEMVAHDQTGLIFTKGSVESLASQLERLVKEPTLRKRLGKAGRGWVVSQRTWTKTGEVAAEKLKNFFK